MDLLASLHLDSLPEQQTRTSRPSVSDALRSNPEVRLGFDACCNCASSGVSVKCGGCGRVSYCCRRCRSEDSSTPPSDPDEEGARGHSAVVCTLLRLCDADEAAEDAGNAREDAAADRVRSEYESYPATLANILSDGPCYRDALPSGGRNRPPPPRRRGKRDRQSGGASSSATLAVHIVGASASAELWGDRRDGADVYGAYAEALTELANEQGLRTVRLIFVGPDCPEKEVQEVRAMEIDGDSSGAKPAKRRLVVQTRRSNYDAEFVGGGPKNGGPIPAADVVVFFNPGFTCPDYEWDAALSCVKPGTPFLVTTNTEMEGMADCQYLFERGYIAELPPMVADIVGEDGAKPTHTEEDAESDCGMFFGENPYAGSRVRQSGNMANDLFVKNKWIFGGKWGKKESRKGARSTALKMAQAKRQADVDGSGESKRLKKRPKETGNTKRNNPALI